MSFGDSPASSLAANVIDGFQMIESQDYWLCITPNTTGVQEVQTIALTGLSASGSYTLSYKEDTTQPLAYNATPVQMAAAFNALPSVFNEQFTVTFSGSLNNGTTATFSPPRDINTLIRVTGCNNFLTSGSVPIVCSVAETTQGVAGLPASGVYDVDIYAYVPRTLEIDPDGNVVPSL